MNNPKYLCTYTIPGIEQLTDGVKAFSLSNNYPSPFNLTTTINYLITELSPVKLKVYDVLGNEITTLVSDEKSAGYYEVEFDTSSLSSGIYFYSLQVYAPGRAGWRGFFIFNSSEEHNR
jgi:hypothetical protein